jgi:hypothetical protein
VTGHGQGNTQNCAEFCNKVHSITANGAISSHNLWRADCGQNPCSPQGGTWTYPRAGWCPGSIVYPWDVDVTAWVTPGADANLSYGVTPYTNYCRPDNPNCVNGQTCADCNYNSNGHTVPVYRVASQLVYYRINPNSGATGAPSTASAGLRVGTASPNPFRPPTSISYSLARPGSVDVLIHDAGGRVIRRLTERHGTAGDFRLRWDGQDDTGRDAPSGLYFYEVRSGAETGSRKMIMLR